MRRLPTESDHPRSRGVYCLLAVSAHGASGSSPLARGLPGPDPPGRRQHGIIPARAGFTTSQFLGRLSHTDHPRSRGVYCAPTARSTRAGGSSPLARGLLGQPPPRGDGRGIIPARAGFTGREPTWGGPGRRPQDHPRSRGVYSLSLLHVSRGTGSSPLARGLRGPGEAPGPPPRIIPARAGFTRIVFPACRRAPDHPRSRGVYDRDKRPGYVARGSSPLARGLQKPP